MAINLVQCRLCHRDRDPAGMQRLPCDHLFDPDCINQWIAMENRTCPLCPDRLEQLEVDGPIQPIANPAGAVAAANAALAPVPLNNLIVALNDAARNDGFGIDADFVVEVRHG